MRLPREGSVTCGRTAPLTGQDRLRPLPPGFYFWLSGGVSAAAHIRRDRQEQQWYDGASAVSGTAGTI